MKWQQGFPGLLLACSLTASGSEPWTLERALEYALGHNPDAFWTPPFVEYFLAGIQYALGDLKADATPSARLTR